MTFTIIRPEQHHRADWGRLFAGYAAFYQVEQSEQMRDRVWSWLHDPAHTVKGFLAVDDRGKPIGLTHYRPYARPLAAATACFLDDLFVDRTERGGRIADALIAAVAEEGRKRGWSLVRWVTADDNYRARAVYDRVSTRTRWITYEIKL